MKIGRELRHEGSELREFVQLERNYWTRISAEVREDRRLERVWEKRQAGTRSIITRPKNRARKANGKS